MALKKPKIYLAGGLKTNWQQPLIELLSPYFEIYNPMDLYGLDIREVARTEKSWLEDSDFVLAYLEKTNPTGFGLAFELGFALARHTPSVFVNEWDSRTGEWAEEISGSHIVKSLSEAVEYARQFAVNFKND